MTAPISLPRRLLAEFLGTALLVTAVVGSGIMATTLSPDDVGLQLLENSIVVAQITGAIAGCVLANLMFDLTPANFATKDRTGGHLWLGEIVATAGLLLLIFALARSGRAVVAHRHRPATRPLPDGRPERCRRRGRAPGRRTDAHSLTHRPI